MNDCGSIAASRPALGPTQPIIQWTLSLGVKRLGHEVDHSSPSSAEVKSMWEAMVPHLSSWDGA
jgi:hypothetical protein